MPTIITASELRSVLGVSSSLYSDSYLNEIIDTAEGVILPTLVPFKSPIQEAALEDNMATFTTLGIHEFTHVLNFHGLKSEAKVETEDEELQYLKINFRLAHQQTKNNVISINNLLV